MTSHAQKLADAGAGAPAPHSGADRPRSTASGSSATAGGCCRSPATTISAWRIIPALKAAAIAAIERHGVGAGASRLVTGNHPLYAELEAAAGAAQGHRGGLRVRLRLSRQRRHHPGAGRARRPDPDRRTGAFQPVDRRAAVARARCMAFRHNDVGHAAELLERASRRASARADRHRRRVLDGRRPRAAGRARRAARERTTPG